MEFLKNLPELGTHNSKELYDTWRYWCVLRGKSYDLSQGTFEDVVINGKSNTHLSIFMSWLKLGRSTANAPSTSQTSQTSQTFQTSQTSQTFPAHLVDIKIG